MHLLTKFPAQTSHVMQTFIKYLINDHVSLQCLVEQIMFMSLALYLLITVLKVPVNNH